MEQYGSKRLLVAWMLLLAGGCSGPREMVTLPTEAQQVEMTVRNFDFSPDLIRARAGQLVHLKVESHSATPHNITVKDPAGRILVSRDLPPQETVIVEVPLREAGEYPFYCDKPLHPTLGMKGRLVAE